MPSIDPLESPRKYWDEESLGDPSRFLAMVGLMRLYRRSTAMVEEVLRRHGLARNGYLLLMSLQLTPTGSRMLGRLARDLLVHPTTVTLTIDRFEQEGLVVKTPHETDGRSIRAAITPAGSQFLSKITAELAEASFGLQGLRDVDVAKLNSVMTDARLAIGDIVS